MSDEEFEKFEITDYDLENEFNIDRPRRKLTKNQQIYGIWADDSDDERPSTFSRNRKQAADFTAPIGFISAGIEQPTKDNIKNETFDEKIEPSIKFQSDSSDSDNEQILNRAGFGHNSHKKQSYVSDDIAGLRRPESVSNLRSKHLMSQRGLGKWEKHTKGIGAKLLLQMGYKPGKGLGKDLQGISAPVEAHLRKGRGTLGAYGPEKHSKLAKLEEAETEVPKPIAKRVIVTVEELLEKSRLSNKSIYYEKINEIQTDPSQSIIENKFMCRIHAIIENNKRKVINYDRLLNETLTKYKYNQENVTQIKKEISEIQNRVNFLRKINEIRHLHIESIELFLQKTEEIIHNYDVKQMIQIVKKVFTEKLTLILANWKSFQQDSNTFYADFEKLKTILKNQSDLYNYLVKKVIVDRVKSDLWQWDMRDCEPVIAFLQKWKIILPDKSYLEIIENFVLNRLKSAVYDWNPQMDLVPLHTWLHPWFLIIGTERMEDEIFSIVELKMCTALAEWHPSDQSAKLLLYPWKNALRQGTLESFLIKYILPKLQSVFQMFQINPNQQQLDIWHWVFDWIDMFPTVVMAQLLEENFLPKWLNTLVMWLNHKPNMLQVNDWYFGWKKLIPEPIMIQTNVKNTFDKALQMIHRVTEVNHDYNTQMPPFIPVHFTYHPTLPPPPPPPPPSYLQNLINETVSITFKDLVLKRCQERGVIFMPIPNRFYQAKQVYKIGKMTQCYIDRNVLFSSTNGTDWIPTSLNTLLDMV